MTEHRVQSHGGFASQAKKRGEEYVMCSVCGVVTRQCETELESFADFLAAFVVMAAFMVALWTYALVAAAS